MVTGAPLRTSPPGQRTRDVPRFQVPYQYVRVGFRGAATQVPDPYVDDGPHQRVETVVQVLDEVEVVAVASDGVVVQVEHRGAVGVLDGVVDRVVLEGYQEFLEVQV